MKQNAKLRRRIACLLLAVTLAMGLLPFDGALRAYAEGLPARMANLVVFVRLKGTTDDFANPDNWAKIYGQFESDAYSFTNYIDLISNGRLHVENHFPQIRTDADGKEYISSYELPESSYDAYGGGLGGGADATLIDDVVEALSDAQSDVNNPLYINLADNRLDYREPGVLDNLTIVLQGATFNEGDHSFKGNYSGGKTIGSLNVACFNAIPSINLIDVTEPDGGTLNSSFGGQGVVAHEFLHTLGLPDLYRLGGNGDPVGPWDIMSSAAYTLQYPLGWQRRELGWLAAEEYTEVRQSDDYTLTAVDRPGGLKLITIKTPLSESASETICIEYRRHNEEYHGIEWRLPGSGLVMYRVNENVPDRTNINGENYIYVYRPGVTTQEDATDTESITTDSGQTITRNRVQGAALSTGSYGSTDLSADFKQNTLYYSSGRNSGVQVSNLTFSGDTVSFHVEFAQYSDTWQPVGDAAAANALASRLYADEASGQLYLAYISTAQQVYVKRWNASANAWEQMGNAIGTSAYSNNISFTACGGALYAAFLDAAGYPVYSRWNGSAWSTPGRIGNDANTSALQLVSDGSGVYAAYQKGNYGNQNIVIRNLNGGQIAVSPMSAADFCNPTVVKSGSKFYIAYTKFMESKAQIDCFDTATQLWSAVYTYRSTEGSINLLHEKNGRLYALAGSSAVADNAGSPPVLAVWNGSSWTETPVPCGGQFYEMTLTLAGQTPYVTFYGGGKAQMLRLAEGQWASCYDGLNGQVSYFEAANIGTQVYAALKMSGADTVHVFAQQVTLAPDDPTDPNNPTAPANPVTPPPTNPATPDNPNPPTGPETPGSSAITVRVTPPAGYTDPYLYVDGVAYGAQQSGGAFTAQLPDTSGKTAVMYFYNERGVPKGMYVWRLSYSGTACTATPLPGLQDLLSYHGFSIRVQSPAGIRFKSGIDTALRAQLLAGGVDGYTLTEYGTISMDVPAQGQYTLVKGGPSVRGGRSYWTADGKTNDRIFEIVDGRYRFASVLIGVPERVYASDMAFRAYAVLRDASGGEIIVYGPPVARSIYTVAKQVNAAGEFAPGSGGYQYIQGILQAVER